MMCNYKAHCNRQHKCNRCLPRLHNLQHRVTVQEGASKNNNSNNKMQRKNKKKENIASSQAFNLLCAFFNLLLLCLQRANVLLRFCQSSQSSQIPGSRLQAQVKSTQPNPKLTPKLLPVPFIHASRL